jgi:Tfp pilus assembly protein PilO
MQRLHPREKIAIGVILALILIFVPAYFLILPVFNDISELGERQTELAGRQKEVTERSMRLPIIEEAYVEVNDEFVSTFADVGATNEAFNIHTLMTNLSVRSHVSVRALTIGSSVNISLPAAPNDYFIRYHGEALGMTAATRVTAPNAVTAGRIPINLTITGVFRDILRFVDNVNDNGFIVVESINIGNMQAEGVIEVRLTMSMYWVEFEDWRAEED